MDFFGQQERARKTTKRLVFLFVLAVMLTIGTVYLAAAFVLRSTYLLTPLSQSPQGLFLRIAHYFGESGMWNLELLGWVLAGVLTILVIGTSFKQWQLSSHGAKLIELLGGRPVDLTTSDPDELRLIHVVEEMSIAAGVPVPDIYILQDENGINALAAGFDRSEAAIGVTFGAVKLLSRDELQGVVAHEFSHILNGDMRLDTQLVGWFHGILGLVVVGRVLTLSFFPARHATADSDRPRRAGPVFHPVFIPAFILGSICIVAGSIGAFFARIVKSALSRQREYLADAAAVQFTRNPAGLAGALKKAGGLRWRSVLDAPRAEEASHMYFNDGVGRRWFGFTSTHPPLEKRIKSLDPEFDGKFPTVSLTKVLRESRAAAAYRELGSAKPLDFEKIAAVLGPAAAAQEFLFAETARGNSQAADSAPVPAKPPRAISLPLASPAKLTPLSAAHLTGASGFLESIPEPLREATKAPFSSAALVYALLCSRDLDTRGLQISIIENNAEEGLISELNRLLTFVDRLDSDAFLPLADLCIRTLRQLSPDQYARFRGNLQQLTESDSQVDLFEYMLQRMVLRHLDPVFGKPRCKPVQYYSLRPLLPVCAVLLSGMARVGHTDEFEMLEAFSVGAAALGENGAQLKLLDLQQCNLAEIDSAISKVAQACVPLKKRILEALVSVAATDGLLNKREAELLRAIADSFDAPLPPFLCATAGNSAVT